MATKVDELYEKASHLAPAERVALAGLLIDTLEGVVDPDIEQAWRMEIAKRIAELDSGVVKTVPGDEVRDRLRNIVGSLPT